MRPSARWTAAALLLAPAAVACERDDEAPAREAEDVEDPTDDEAAPSAEAGGPSYPMEWHEDDYDAALAAAREREQPVVVVMWAPWCHTCLSMHNEVLTDDALEPVADRFVWLMVDTDKGVNAPVLDALSIEVWPTSYVLSPDETVQARLTSAASVEQFRDFVLEGERAHVDEALEAGDLDDDRALAEARRGDRALARDDYGAAFAAYERALENAEREWARRPDVLVSYMHAAMRAGDAHDCKFIARSQIDETGAGASAVRFSRYVLWCAESQVEDELETELLALADDRLSELLAGDHQLSSDDQSTALRTRRRIHEHLGDDDEARALAERQRALLDRAAEDAIGPRAASTYSWPRAEVYTYLGEPEALLPDLVELAESLPDQYDPPYRAAWLALRAGELDEAASWAERSRELAYGPRKSRVLELLAEIHREAGDEAAERGALEALIAHLESLPPSQEQPEKSREARARLSDLAT